jgi:hypothetical protein
LLHRLARVRPPLWVGCQQKPMVLGTVSADLEEPNPYVFRYRVAAHGGSV